MQDVEKEFGPTSWSIDNKTTIYIITLLLCVAGIFSYIKLGKEKFPDIVIPRIIVATIYPGTSPTDIENLVTRQLEKEIKSVNGVKKISSTSNQDYCIVDVEFNSGVDVQYAKQLIKDAVDKAQNELPNDLPSPPTVQEVNLSELPIMNINLAGNLPVSQLKKYADDFQDKIEALPEITRVDIIGALDQQVNVDVDLNRLRASRLSFTDVSAAIARENITISGGSVNVGDQKRAVRVAGQYARAADIANIQVKNLNGAAVRLGDIATVTDAFKDRESYARLDGKTAITLNVIKRQGENLIDASDKIKEVIKDSKTSLPSELTITVTGDTSNDTRVTLHDLINTIIIGFILVTLILMFFMGTTNALFVGLSVPISMFLAFVLLPGFGFALNMIVLFAFLLALGIVVDDAIVVIENTHRLLHEHPNLTTAQAAKYAAGEVFIPVLAGTLTTVAPFVPLMFWPGIVGSFMFYLPVTLILTLMSSLIVAFIMNPVFAVSFMEREDHHSGEKPKVTRNLLIWTAALVGLGILFNILGFTGKAEIGMPVASGASVGVGVEDAGFFQTHGHFLGNLLLTIAALIWLNTFLFNRMIAGFQTKVLPRFQNGYASLVNWAISHPVLVMVSMVVLFFISIFAVGARSPKVDFFPSGDPKFVYTYLKMPVGTRVEVTDSVARELENRIYKVIGKDNPDVESVITNVAIGASDPGEASASGTSQSNLAKVAVAFKEMSERTGPATSTYMDKIREAVKGIPGTEISVDKEASGPPQGKAIAIEVAGDDYPTLIKLSKDVTRYIESKKIGGIEQLRSNLEDRNPEIAVDINRIRANREGISTAQIGSEVRTAIYGTEASKFKTPDDEYPIQVRYAEPYRSDVDAILNSPLTFRDATGAIRQVPISSVADVRYGTTYGGIKRKDVKRVITISSNVLNGFTGPDVVRQIETSLKAFPTPPGYSVKMGGAQEDQEETSSFLGVAAVGAIALIFLVLVMQFNSVSKPVIILTEIIFSVVGVMLGLAITGMNISIVMTGVGIIALAGIVVKNGILLVEFTDILRSQGMPLREAIVMAGRTRLNPVILTATAATLGLIPLAIGLNIDFYELFNSFQPHFFIGGESVTFWGPLAWTIIFGLVFATVITLVVVPVMYLITESLKLKIFGKPANTDATDSLEQDSTVRQRELTEA
ncbi:efflux RND transporter permease subunit [Microvirga sp. STR05]|uniref:Efflux RND transporter permease subunit n=1 Tax=Hymenobacter duratus TaxID=2771356 RepID=A0ABR8JDI7_9BACT|nr:efflux RND transporter permease subunit [Hymenobacter duratus]MBD2713825.1 efflux RND transporter permease subunit [Hymenobacter duratus]MBR7948727.1 efflux RND transporter permease subunit [Microvirga sp. STR05]